MAQHIRRDDLVIVTSGDDRGRQGRVLKVMPKEHRVIVEGVNMRKRHIRPSAASPQGGIIQRELSIHISNVSPVVDGKATRVRFVTRDDGSKARIAARNGEQVGPELKKARR